MRGIVNIPSFLILESFVHMEWWSRFGLSPQGMPSELEKRCMKAIWMEDHDLIKLVHKYNCPWIMRREFNTFYQGPNTSTVKNSSLAQRH